jgi:hypothetical protein
MFHVKHLQAPACPKFPENRESVFVDQWQGGTPHLRHRL